MTRGNGGYDMLDYRDVPVPQPTPGEVLLQVLAAGVRPSPARHFMKDRFGAIVAVVGYVAFRIDNRLSGLSAA